MTSLPILAFHSVGDRPLPGDLAHLTATPALFDRCLGWLARKGFTTLSLGEVHGWLKGETEIPPKSICLVFDDGYVDNWAFAHPALAKHGLKATVVVTPEFVRPDEGLSPTLEDAEAGRVSREALPGPGYLSWEELRAMKESGIWDIQSHFQTHTRLPISDQVVGYHHPDSSHYWMCWNADPAGKPTWMSLSLAEFNRSVPWGTPILESARSQVATAVHPDPARARRLVEFVESRGGETFFQTPDWRSLLSEVDKAGEWEPGRRETSEEKAARIQEECEESRRLIESNIPGQKANFLAWPGGEWDAACQKIAVGVGGYTATRTTLRRAMRRGDDPHMIHCGFFGQKAGSITGGTLAPFLLFKGWVLRLGGQPSGRLLIFLGNRLRDLVGFFRRSR